MSKQNSRYVDDFFGQKCAEDILPLGVFPKNRLCKEITESMGAFRAAVDHCDVQRNDPNVLAIVIGDGHQPRTAVLLAFLTKWMCISVDPNMRLEKSLNGVQRVLRFRDKIEATRFSITPNFNRLLVFAVHSHGPLRLEYNAFKVEIPLGGNLGSLPVGLDLNRIDVIAIPCCRDQFWDNGKANECLEYVDPCIWSPKNLVKVYRNTTLAE